MMISTRCLYIKDPTKTTTNSSEKYKDDNISVAYNLELVFQNNATPENGRYHVKTYHLDGEQSFASIRYHSREYSVNSNVPSIKSTTTTTDIRCPWFDKDADLVASGERIARNIVTVDFKDEIAPTYIASWFYGFDRIREFKHLENLNLSNCKDMSFAFCCSTSTSRKYDTTELEELDLSCLDIRYYDANGMMPVFYNTYRNNMYYGGCLCSFNQVSSMAIKVDNGEPTEG